MQSGATKVRPFELFFDLVFAFCLIQITNTIVADNDVLGVAHGLAVLCIVWLVWAGFTSLANMGLPPGHGRDWRPPVFVLAMGLMLLVGVSIPTAFWEGDKLFAYAIGALMLTWFACYLKLTAGRPDLRRDVYRMGAMASLLPVFVIISSYLVSTWLATALLAMGLITAALTPFAAKSPAWPMGRSHLAERYELFIIIALGETLISIGLGATNSPRSPELIAGILISVLLVAVMWRAYLVGVCDTGRSRLSDLEGSRAMRFSRIAYVYIHLLLAAGIILVAAGLKVSMKDVESVVTPLFGALLLAGLALFTLAILIFRYAATGHWEWWRLLAVCALLAVWFAVERTPDLVFLTLTTVVATLCALPDLRRKPDEVPQAS